MSSAKSILKLYQKLYRWYNDDVDGFRVKIGISDLQKWFSMSDDDGNWIKKAFKFVSSFQT